MTLEDGTEVRSWEELRECLQAVLAPDAREAPPMTDDSCRRGSRKRMRHLEYWANERVVYQAGVIVGAVVRDA